MRAPASIALLVKLAALASTSPSRAAQLRNAEMDARTALLAVGPLPLGDVRQQHRDHPAIDRLDRMTVQRAGVLLEVPGRFLD